VRFELATIGVLVQRDVMIFFRQLSRVAGALLQPLLFWLVLGFGLAPSFKLQGGSVDYRSYFFPGVVLLIVLFTSIFQTMSVIEDRREGFLQGVLAGPGSRFAVVAGKTLGSTTVALVQAILFLALAPVAGFPYRTIAWGELILVLILAAAILAALGFGLAWALDSTQGYHVVMSLLLLPAWILSGAVFPATGVPPVLAALVRWNPLGAAVVELRRALHGGTLPAGTVAADPGALRNLVALVVTTAVLMAIATVIARRNR